MASRPTRNSADTPERQPRLVPVRVVVVVYIVAAVLWILGSSPLGDMFTQATGIPRWAVEIAKGVLFVAVTAVVLQVVLRRREDAQDAAEARTRDTNRKLSATEGQTQLQAAALSSTASAVLITERDGTIEWVNAAFERMSGYPASVAVGATPRLLRSGEHDAGFYRQLWETILAGQVWHGEIVNRRRDGALFTVSQTITPVVATPGEVQYFVAVQEDITARIRAEQQLEASRAQLQALFDHALDAIVLADDQGRYTEVNPAVSALTGYSRDELLGMRAADLVATDQQPAEMANRFATFLAVGAESGTFALRHKDGHVVQTEYRAVAGIQPGVHLSILRDVTARYEMLRALTLAEAEFRGLAEHAADIVAKLRVDDDGRRQVDYINPAVTTILGYPQQELYDDPDLLFDLLHLRDDDRDHDHDRDDAQDDDHDRDHVQDLHPTPEEPITLATVQVEGADGRPVWLEIHSTLTDPPTSPVTIQLVARDVTARLEMTQALEEALDDQLAAAEQLRTLSALKDTFLQSVSHELRTPLTSILGFAQLLADPDQGLSPAQTRGFHERILNNARRLQRLVDDLLDVDGFAQGRIEVDREPTDLSALIERMVHEVDLDDHQVALDLEPITMELDALRIERLVTNLLHNVVRHTPADSRVWVRTRATPDGVELTVDDDGPGIPDADRQRLIAPLHQGVGAMSSAQPGLGVGLSLATTFAQVHGGDLAITDSPAGGTRITVTLAHPRTGDRQATADLATGGS